MLNELSIVYKIKYNDIPYCTVFWRIIDVWTHKSTIQQVIYVLGALQHFAIGVPHNLGVVCSVAAILLYLSCGGFYAGTFTDGVQFIYLCIGMVITKYPSYDVTSNFT